jgi:maltose alpha-D-glucosyltransferase/alpha-amylase
LINGLLCSLPGTPVLYYGDEIAMGDNVYLGDRNGVRTPMQWSADRNAGFSTANPQQLILPVVIDYEYHYQTINVEAQDSNPHSLLWWMRRLIALRQRFKAFGRGSMEFLTPENPHVVAFVRSYEGENILVAANLSRFVQYVELDLSKFKGQVPRELFSHAPFPAIGDLPYLLTFGPHGFLWFSIEPVRESAGVANVTNYVTPQIELPPSKGFSHTRAREVLQAILPAYLPHCRWFRSKSRTISSAEIVDTVSFSEDSEPLDLALVHVTYRNGEPETYTLPLGIAFGEAAAALRASSPEHIIAELKIPNEQNGNGVVYDATANPEFGRALLEVIRRNRRSQASAQRLHPVQTQAFKTLIDSSDECPEPRVLKVEQSNTSLIFGDRFIMKLFRKLDAGVNPDIEVGKFLTDRAHYANTPALAGWTDYAMGGSTPVNLTMLQAFAPNQGDAWEYSRNALGQYFEAAASRSEPAKLFVQPLTDMIENLSDPDVIARELMGTYLDAARLMGQRVAELHLAFLVDKDDPNFAPEPYSELYRRSQYQSMRNLLGRVMRLLMERLNGIAEEQRGAAQALYNRRDQIQQPFELFLKCKPTVVRSRIHGDLHLGQMLYNGKDFLIIDFEGEPARPLEERRRKRSSLRDVAGMLRSFEYAAFSQLTHQLATGALGTKIDFVSMEPWVRFWQQWTSWAFLQGYQATSAGASHFPKDRDELRILLDAFTLEKAIYELGYELDNRPDWVLIPIYGITRIIDAASTTRDRPHA